MTPSERNLQVACSDCFKDFGLRYTAKKHGEESSHPCKYCRSSTGKKLSRATLEEVCHEFFVLGTGFKGRGWLASRIAFNTCSRGYDKFGPIGLQDDLHFLHLYFGLNCFFYGPPLWMFGKPPDEDGVQRWDQRDFQYICESCPELVMPETEFIFRVQCNLDDVLSDERFCSPPDRFRKNFGRFDSKDLPILYASFDIETCLHESRVTLRDEIYLATLRPLKTLRLLDLSDCKAQEKITSFEDPNIWLNCLLFDSDSYEHCQKLALQIKNMGYDGFVSKSYFQQAATREHKNVSIFGRPVIERILKIECINRIVPQNVLYDYVIGPAISKSDTE